jgi:hypothetical protein
MSAIASGGTRRASCFVNRLNSISQLLISSQAGEVAIIGPGAFRHPGLVGPQAFSSSSGAICECDG